MPGGAGFIGSNFVRYILDNDNDIEILNLDDLKYGSNLKNLENLEKNARYTFFKGDISNYPVVSELIRDVDSVVNFAAETHVDRSISAPEAFLQNNVVGTFTLLDALRKVNPSARMVHISTDEVYGDIHEGSFKETDALRPSSPYSASTDLINRGPAEGEDIPRGVVLSSVILFSNQEFERVKSI